MKAFVFSIWMLCVTWQIAAQLPERPNKYDEDSLRTGEWIILFDSAYQNVVQKESEAEYYCLAELVKDKPKGTVECFYISGIKQWDGTMLSIVPEIKHGDATFYHKLGNIKVKTTFVNDHQFGPYEEYFENGVLAYKGVMKNDSLSGHWDFYYQNGNLESRGEFIMSKREGFWEFYHDNGQLHFSGQMTNDQYQGPWTYYHPNGVMKFKTSYVDHKEHGDYVGYHENGALSATGKFKNGLNDGKWTYYYDNGQVQSEGIIVNGLYQGNWKFYHTNGKIGAEREYVDDKEDGMVKYYFENGTLKSEGIAHNDVWNGFITFYHDNGNIESMGEIVNGSYEGPWESYFRDGKKRSVKSYLRDTLNGHWELYHENGNLYEKGTLIIDSKEGPFEVYYPNGQLKFKGPYKNDVHAGFFEYYYENGNPWKNGIYYGEMKQGPFEFYFENGQLKSKGNYDQGKANGEWIYYHENGALSTKGLFDYGNSEGYWTYYYDDGTLKEEGNEHLDKAEGYRKYYYKGGIIKREGSMIAGKRDGWWKYYHPNGILNYEGNTLDGKGVGHWTYYDTLGRKKSEGSWKDDLQSGIWTYYDTLGNIRTKGEYVEDFSHGKWIVYKNGKKSGAEYYDRGKLLDFHNLKDSAVNVGHRYEEDSAFMIAKRAKKAWKQQYKKDSVGYHLYWRMIGDIYRALGMEEEAIEEYERSLKEVARIEGLQSWNYSIILSDMANTNYNLNQYKKAVDQYSRSLETIRNMHDGKKEMSYYVILRWLAYSYFYDDQPEIAFQLLEEDLRFRLDSFPEDKENIAEEYFTLAELKYRNSSYDSALVVFNDLDKYITANDLQHTQTYSDAARITAYVYNSSTLNNGDSTIFYHNKSIRSYRDRQDTLTTGYLYNYIGLGDEYYTISQDAIAKEYFDSALYKCEIHNIKNYNIYIESILGKAKVMVQLFDYENSLELYNKALDIAEKNPTKNKKWIAKAYLGIAINQAAIYPDEPELAEESYLKVLEYLGGSKEYNSDYANTSQILGDFYRRNKLYDKAKSQLLRAKEYMIKHNHEGLYLSRVHKSLGMMYYNRYLLDSSELYHKIALEYYKKNLNDYSSDYALGLGYIGDIYEDRNNYEEGEKYILKGLNVLKEYGKENTMDYASTLSQLAYNNRLRGEYENAIVFYKQSLALKEQIVGKNNEGYVNTLSSLAISYTRNDDYNSAAKVLDEVGPLTLTYTTKNSNDYLDYLQYRGDVLNYQKKYEEAREVFHEMLAISEKINKSAPESHAYFLREIGKFYKWNRKPDKALHYLEPAVKLVESSLGRNNEKYAWYSEILGDAYYSVENYREALRINEEIVQIYKEVAGEDSYQFIDAYSDLGSLYKSLGRFAESEEVELYVGDLIEKKYGKISLTYSDHLEKLGFLYRWWGKHELALENLQQSLTILDSMTDTHVTHYYSRYSMLGLTLSDIDRYDEANEYLQKARNGALDYWGKTANYYTYTNNLAFVYLGKGDYETAEKLYLEAGSRFETYETATPLELINYEDNLAGLYLAWGKMDKAGEYWTRVTEGLLKQVNADFAYMSESEKANFWDAYKKDFEYFNTYAIKAAATNPKAIGQMYNNQLQTKSILLSTSTKERRRIVNSGDSLLISKYFEYVDLKENLAKYYGYTDEQLAAENINVDSLETEANHYEQMLSLNANDLAKEEKAKKLRWKDIQRKLNEDEAAVEMIRFKYFDKHVTDSVLYAALIVTSETRKSPEIVVLANGEELESKYLKNYRTSIRFKVEDRYSYQNYWSAIDEKLKGKKVVYFSPDAVFNQINVNTFQRPDGTYILDDYNVNIVTSTRDILLMEKETKEMFSKQLANLFGFPQYDLAHSSIENIVLERSIERSRNLERDLDLTRFGFTELPGTKTETESIEQILSSNAWDTELYLGDEALEEILKSVNNPSVLHIATHGFFLDDIENGDQVKLGVQSGKSRKDPLLRSGLLLAGAAQTVEGDYDNKTENGIFTAYEAMNLNLDDTELVVLSACETGRGEVKSGEGVYGLQRAFQVAGAESIIMSLWKVNDEATQMLMTNFYQNWIKGIPKNDAFKAAQLAVRNQYSHPYYWGAFVMIGG